MKTITEQKMDELVNLAEKSKWIIQVKPGWFVRSSNFHGQGWVMTTSNKEEAQKFDMAELKVALDGTRDTWESAKAISLSEEDES